MIANAVAAAVALAVLSHGCSESAEQPADDAPVLTRDQLRAQRGDELRAKLDKVIAVLDAAMRVPRPTTGEEFAAIQSAIRVTDLVVGWDRKAKPGEANALVFAMGDVTQELGRMLDRQLWAAEKRATTFNDIALSNSASGFFDLAGVARFTDADSYYEKDKRDWKANPNGIVHDVDALLALRYLVVVKQTGFARPQVTGADTYSPGHFGAHVLVYDVDSGQAVGQLTVFAKMEGAISGPSVDSVMASFRGLIRDAIEARLASSIDPNAEIALP